MLLIFKVNLLHCKLIYLQEIIVKRMVENINHLAYLQHNSSLVFIRNDINDALLQHIIKECNNTSSCIEQLFLDVAPLCIY